MSDELHDIRIRIERLEGIETQPYFTDWSSESLDRVEDEYNLFKRQPSMLVWECSYCGVFNELSVIDGCTGCGANRVTAHLRAIWAE